MAVYLLTNIDDNSPQYDVAEAFVIKALSEQAARRIAAAGAGDEGKEVWLDPARSSIAFISDQPAGLILRAFRAG